MDFRAALKRQVTDIGRKFKLNNDLGFAMWVATTILDLDEDSAFEAVSIEGANDKGVDLFYVDDTAGRVLLLQSKYSPQLSYHAKEKDISILESSINWLVNPAAAEKEGRPELAAAARDYVEAINKDYGTDLVYLYAGPPAQNADKKIAVYNQNPEHLSKNRAIRQYNLALLENLWNETQGKRVRIPSDVLLTEGCFETTGNFGHALVATIPCSELVRLYNQHKDSLFVRNVRLYLGAKKGSVNAEIAGTVNDLQERGNFWAYNNGVTIICDNFGRVGKSKVRLTNFSIVNGCQTTVSLAENNGTDSTMSLLARVIAASGDIVDNVIRYTNSQNPIRPWDIASQIKTQRRLKQEFDKLKEPYIYLTRRGDSPHGNTQKYRTGGKLRQIQFDRVGQYLAAFEGKPVLAYKEKAFIFSREHDRIFPPDIKVEEVLFVWICADVCAAAVREAIGRDETSEVLLKRGGTLFSLAVLGEILKTRNGATYLTKLEEARVRSTRTREKLQKAAKYAVSLYTEALNDELETTKSEITTLLRDQTAFAKVLARAMRKHERGALNRTWIEGAVPKLW